jgi:hypothetical protein
MLWKHELFYFYKTDRRLGDVVIQMMMLMHIIQKFLVSTHVSSQKSSVEPLAFLVHTQMNTSTPEEVLFSYWKSAENARS